MPKYCVQIEASNFLVDIEGKLAKHGFLTLKFVEADDPIAAENTAVQMLRDDEELRVIVKNDSMDPPVMDVMEIIEVDSFDGVDSRMDRIWYEINPKRWWQFWR